MVNSTRVFHTTRWLVAVFLLVFFVYPYLRSRPHAKVRDRYAEILGAFPDDKKLFVADLLQNEVGGDFDGSALARLCASKTWFPESQGIIVSCEPVPGGFGRVKNGLLNCIRFAIEIGAQLVFPRMAQRSAADISNLHGGQSSKGLSLDYMFSVSHLTDSLQTHCPQLRIYDSLDALYDKPSLLKPLPISVSELTSSFITLQDIPTTIIESPDRIRSQFLAYLDEHLPLETRRYPVRVHLVPTLFAWPSLNETTGLRAEFGKLLHVRDQIRVLAASALWNLAQKHAVVLPSPRTGFGGDDESSGFLGVHLRTEKDARDGGGMPGYDDQVAYFFDYLQTHASSSSVVAGESHRRPVVFLATGLTEKDDDVKRFRLRATELNAGAVVLKRDLLDATEIHELNRLSWDQRALVDYEILLRARTMLGIVDSSFAWAVALRRAEGYESGGEEAAATAFHAKPDGDALVPGTYDKPKLEMWADRWSRLFGRANRPVAVYLGSWP